ncbi:MAG: sigma 54-interacting transcriptional regulator [Bacillota bacterium]
MTDSLRAVIEGEDRLGITMDVLKILYRNNLNIRSMEVYPGVIYVKLDWDTSRNWEKLARGLEGVSGVRRVGQVEVLPSEKSEQQMKAVLNSVSEGIIAIDREGRISLINPAAEKILQCSSESVIDRPLKEVLSPGVPMLKVLESGKGYDNEEILINTARGRSHYVTTGRPIQNEKGKITGVVAALKDMSQVRELVYSITRPSMVTFDDIVGTGAVMKNVVEMAKTVARTHSTVLLRGESGTGKELFARAIHMASPRRHKPFLPVNCAAIPDSLLESELFGYEEGSFTNARRGGKQGLFEFAHQGTIFLDEIGELSPHLQAKLLRVLQEGKVRRIGGKEELPVDVRILAATSRNLEEMLQQGAFREDLYYRLNVIPLFLPPLREHKEDIPALARAFINNLNPRLNASVSGISPDAVKKLLEYHWPGNIRELANVIERAMNLAAGTATLDTAHLLIMSREIYIPQPGAGIPADNVNSENTTQKTLAEQVAEAEVRALRQALAANRSSRLAGRALGVSHTTILKKIKKYKLEHLETGTSDSGS